MEKGKCNAGKKNTRISIFDIIKFFILNFTRVKIYICVHTNNINVNVLKLEYFYNLFIGRSYLETQRKNALSKFNQSHYKCHTKVTVSRKAVAMCFI